MSISESHQRAGERAAGEPNRRTRTRLGRLRLGGTIAVLSTTAAVLLGGAGPAQAFGDRTPTSTGTVFAWPEVNVRPGAPALGPDMSQVIGTIPYGTTVQIDCVVSGPSVTGPYGTTTLWDRLPGYQGDAPAAWVSDAWIDTGRSDPSVDNSLC